jgi:hypothetical protein
LRGLEDGDAAVPGAGDQRAVEDDLVAVRIGLGVAA